MDASTGKPAACRSVAQARLRPPGGCAPGHRSGCRSSAASTVRLWPWGQCSAPRPSRRSWAGRAPGGPRGGTPHTAPRTATAFRRRSRSAISAATTSCTRSYTGNGWQMLAEALTAKDPAARLRSARWPATWRPWPPGLTSIRAGRAARPPRSSTTWANLGISEQILRKPGPRQRGKLASRELETGLRRGDPARGPGDRRGRLLQRHDLEAFVPVAARPRGRMCRARALRRRAVRPAGGPAVRR